VRTRRTLYRRVYLHGVLLLVVLMVALSAVGAIFGRDPRYRLHPGRLVEHVTHVLESVPSASLPPLLSRMADDLDVDLAVYSAAGQRLAVSGANPPAALKAEDASRLIASGKVRRVGHRTASRRLDDDRYVRLRSRADESGMFFRAVAGLGVIVLVLALVSIPFARAIARPLEHLSGVARRWGGGDLTARARLDRRDEIGELARTFDETAERVGLLLEGQRELLANVSHELRTPLARMRVSLALAAEATAEDAPRHLAAIESDADDLERLVADLLTTARLDAGGALALHRTPSDLGKLVGEALERFARLYPGRIVERQVGETPAVNVEAGLIARVVDNVLDNAAKYSEADRPITVVLEPADGGVRLVVRDQGIGVTLEDHARIFAPFFRTDRSRARDTGGAGLGLSLSKKIVDAHGGRITVDSQPGAGTAITMWLPA
jgi:two-component system, OmpR family, sensor kinase